MQILIGSRVIGREEWSSYFQVWTPTYIQRERWLWKEDRSGFNTNLKGNCSGSHFFSTLVKKTIQLCAFQISDQTITTHNLVILDGTLIALYHSKGFSNQDYWRWTFKGLHHRPAISSQVGKSSLVFFYFWWGWSTFYDGNSQKISRIFLWLEDWWSRPLSWMRYSQQTMYTHLRFSGSYKYKY